MKEFLETLTPGWRANGQCSLITLTGSLRISTHRAQKSQPVSQDRDVFCSVFCTKQTPYTSLCLHCSSEVITLLSGWNHTPIRPTYVLHILTLQVFDRHLSGHEQDSPVRKRNIQKLNEQKPNRCTSAITGRYHKKNPANLTFSWPFTVWSNAILPYLLQFQEPVSDEHCKSSDNNSEQWFLHGSHVYGSKVKLESAQLHYSWS